MLTVTSSTHRQLVVKLDEEELNAEVMIHHEVVVREVPDGTAAHRVAEEPVDSRAVVVQSPLKI